MDGKRKVLVIQRVHDAGIELLEARDDVEFEVYQGRDHDELVRRIADVHGIVVRTAVINEAVIAAGKRLEIISRHGVGYDAVDLSAATARGIPVTITPGANSVSVAEHAMFLLLAVAKNALANDRATRGGQFEPARTSMKPVDLEGKRLLIVGFGRTGSLVAPRAQAFGMKVFAFDPYIDRSKIERAGCTVVEDFEATLPSMDAVTLHTPLTTQTESMLGEAQLASMKSSAIVVNTARGGIVAEAALADALSRGAIAGAGLDVFDGEPAPPALDNSLFAFDNVIVSPHCAGVSLEASVRTARYAVKNVLDCFDGCLDPAVVVNQDMLEGAPTK